MKDYKAHLTIIEESGVKEEIRRFTISADNAYNFLCLKEKLQSIFPSLSGKRFVITWKDAEDDSVIISSDEELRIALQDNMTRSSYLKLFISLQSDQEKNVYFQSQEEGILHRNVICDGCNKDVKGFRYKCIECEDYDLCYRCEGKGLHAEHCMFRIAEPVQWSSRHGKRLAHHIKKFMRSNVPYIRRQENARECPIMKERHRRRHGTNCDSTSMIETLIDILDSSDYTAECSMDNASNLPETATEATASCNQSQSQETKANKDNPMDIFKDTIDQTITPILNQLGINISMKLDDKKSDLKSNNASTNEADYKKASIISEKFDLKSNNASTNEANSKEAQMVANNKSGKSSDDDDWTIVNQEEKSSDANASDIAKTLPSSSSPSECINKNMSQEPIAPSAPVNESQNTNLYPQLPQPTVTQPIVYHPNPKIQSAVVTMMDMGFSNEDGWLTQLLLVEDGNITKVLDKLLPVGM